MISGPELARLVTDFEVAMEYGFEEDTKKHIKKIISVIEKLGNPFLEDSDDLLVLDTRNIMPETVKQTINPIENTGEDQYKCFIEEWLIISGKGISGRYMQFSK